jgi:glyoxylase I family protein
MSIIAFDHFNLSAHRTDLERLCDFYVDVIGLEAGPRPPSILRHGYWLYAGGLPVLHLIEARAGEVRQPDVAGSFNHVAFRCKGYGQTLAKLSGQGISPRRAEDPAQRLRQLFFKDPMGNGVELAFDMDEG